MKKNKVLIISICAVGLIMASFFIWKFTSQTTHVDTNIQSSKSEPEIKLSKEEQIYKDLVGNLTNVINDTEKSQVQTLINKLVKIENNGNDNKEKESVYKEIIKILDEVTLRGHNKDELEEYKKYFSAAKKSANLFPEMYRYIIKNDGGLESDIRGINEFEHPEHTEEWENIKKIIPFELIKEIKYFVPFEIDKSTGSYMMGFMQPLDFGVTPYEWCVGVELEADKDKLPYIMIHEYGHFISLRDTTLKFTDKLNGIKSEGGELLQSFVANCLGHISEELEYIDESNHYLFYARHKDDFVSKYAATNLLDDFAESFAHFVMGSNYDSEVLKRKMEFFNNREEIVIIKNQILNNMKKNNMGEITAVTQ